MKPAAITASLVDVRNIAAHKCVRLEIHVPAEQCTEVLAAFGWPTMVNPVQVAVARIDPKAALTLSDDKERPKPEEADIFKPRRAWNDMSAVQQAGIRCGEKAFWRFLESVDEAYAGAVISADDAADHVRNKCRVSSRKELLPNTPAEKRWQFLESAYQAWVTDEKYSEVAR